MSKTTLWFRSWTSAEIVAPASGDSVFLIGVRYSAPAQSQRPLEVFGVTYGSVGLDVTIHTESGSTTVSTSAAASGRFLVQVQIPANALAPVVRVRNTDTGASGVDSAVFLLRDADLLPLESHQSFGVDGNRLGYAAGSPDRLSYSRTFVKLDPVPLWVQAIGKLVVGNESDGYAMVHPDAIHNFTKAAAELRRVEREPTGKTRDYRSELDNLLKANLKESLAPAPKEIIERIARQRAERNAWAKAHTERDKAESPGIVVCGVRRKETNASGQPKLQSMMATYPALLGEVVVDTSNSPVSVFEDFVEDAMAYWQAHARLGVLFHERTRIRPTNQVFGEPIYQLALTPGEEVQIRQITETKRRTAFSEITDQQAEQETSFSSTWSTDMASTIASQQSFQGSTNIGAAISGEVPEVPVGISADVASTVSNADSASTQSVVNSKREQTEAATARMRQQHRVQIDLATEDNQSLGTTRTLRNFNQQRSMLHTFYKMYRKEQITLERFGAQLCMRLAVVDPARETRAAFYTNLNKIDPAVRAWKNVLPPVAEITASNFDTVTPLPDDGGLFHGFEVERARTRAYDFRALAGIDDTDLVLVEPPRFTMTECEVVFHVDNLNPINPDPSFDPSTVGEHELSEAIPNVWVGWSYVRNGGRVRWIEEPSLESETATAKLRVTMPLFYTAPSLLGEPEKEIARVRFRIDTRWGPSTQARAEYISKVHEERLRLMHEFDTDWVYQLHHLAETDYPGNVVDRALQENLAYPPEFDFRQVKELFDLEGVVIDNVPHWASPSGRSAHDALMLRLQRLPSQLALNSLLTDSLTASQAVVYLPIRPGLEEAALQLLPEAKDEASEIAQDAKAYRDQHFGPTRQMQIPSVEQHMSPTPVIATPAGSGDWTNDWERPQNKFDILAQWSALVPSDGVHVETHLSGTVATDEHEINRLTKITSDQQ